MCQTLNNLFLLSILSLGIDVMFPMLLQLLVPSSSAWMHLFSCMTDSLCHGLVAGMVWALTCYTLKGELNRSGLLQCSSSMFLSCALDFDHFLAARSLSLEAATQLSSRPLGHSVLFICVCTLFFHLAFSSPMYSVLVSSALFSHQLRDALRRGFYLW